MIKQCKNCLVSVVDRYESCPNCATPYDSPEVEAMRKELDDFKTRHSRLLDYCDGKRQSFKDLSDKCRDLSAQNQMNLAIIGRLREALALSVRLNEKLIGIDVQG